MNKESYNKIIELKNSLKLINGENDRLLEAFREKDNVIKELEEML